MKMPFLGKDWRSPGDQWVRTQSGWERLKLWRIKVFEHLNENLLARLLRLAVNEVHSKDDGWYQHHQPHILYVRGVTRERKVLTSLSEAFVHLDMSGAAKDIRRFNYVAKVLEILLNGKLANLSGTSQKYVISILQDLVNQVTKTKLNVTAVRDLLNCTVNTLTEGEHYHIGSKSLWHRHIQNVNKMVAKLNTITVDQRANDGRAMFEDLPEDCIRCILKRLPDHRDIMRTSQTNSSIHTMAEDRILWKQMCFFHFTDRQLITFLPKELETDQEHMDWKYIYKRCVKRFGKKDVFADNLAICCYCDTLFWKSIGHPCHYEEEPMCRSLSPASFIQLFSI